MWPSADTSTWPLTFRQCDDHIRVRLHRGRQETTWGGREGRRTKPGPKLGVCGEHGGAPNPSTSSIRHGWTRCPAPCSGYPSLASKPASRGPTMEAKGGPWQELRCPTSRRTGARSSPARPLVETCPKFPENTKASKTGILGRPARLPLAYANPGAESSSESMRFPALTGRSRSWIPAGGWVASTAVNGSRILYVCRACRGTTHESPGSNTTI